jgi:FkbM family methyltransferase
MKRPFVLSRLPAWLRQRVYFKLYRRCDPAWRDLFTAAPLAVTPKVTMYDLVPGDEISGMIAFLGFYEWELTKQIAQHARRGGLLVDVGANMGYFTLLWTALNATSEAVAFEPSPRNITLLRNNIAQNHCEDRVSVIAKAAGDRNGTVSFDMGPVEQTGWGGIAEGLAGNSTLVPMVRLDEQLPDKEIEVLKIDTEGADTLVLYGCERLLKARKVRTIYFEENADKISRIGLKRSEAQDFLRSMNYDCRSFRGSETEWFAHPA